jgi:predicted alpha/beta superfamily hydrolase
MGGLISVYALAARPDVFGWAGVISPALWFADGRVLRDDAARLRPGPRVYVDVGGREGEDEATAHRRLTMSKRYVEDARTLRDLLIRNGFRLDADLLYVEDAEARHHQSAWSERMPAMLRFLLPRATPE